MTDQQAKAFNDELVNRLTNAEESKAVSAITAFTRYKMHRLRHIPNRYFIDAGLGKDDAQERIETLARELAARGYIALDADGQPACLTGKPPKLPHEKSETVIDAERLNREIRTEILPATITRATANVLVFELFDEPSVLSMGPDQTEPSEFAKCRRLAVTVPPYVSEFDPFAATAAVCAAVGAGRLTRGQGKPIIDAFFVYAEMPQREYADRLCRMVDEYLPYQVL